MNDWIKCSERMPEMKEGQKEVQYLVYHEAIDEVLMALFATQGWCSYPEYIPLSTVTHWMPLPPKPIGAKNGS